MKRNLATFVTVFAVTFAATVLGADRPKPPPPQEVAVPVVISFGAWNVWWWTRHPYGTTTRGAGTVDGAKAPPRDRTRQSTASEG